MTDDEFAEAVVLSISISEVIRRLGRAQVGSNFKFVKKHIVRLELDTSHFKGQAHGTSRSPNALPLDAHLVEGSTLQRGKLKKCLLREGRLQNECYECGLLPVWNGKPLVLQLEHRNGIRDDCRIENLQLLCPNCHSQTPTYAGRNKKRSRS